MTCDCLNVLVQGPHDAIASRPGVFRTHYVTPRGQVQSLCDSRTHSHGAQPSPHSPYMPMHTPAQTSPCPHYALDYAVCCGTHTRRCGEAPNQVHIQTRAR